ncbi:MAG: Uma2 family endonuclease [Clostridia bacterium]
MSMPAKKLPQSQKYSRKDYLAWSDEERWEIIDGTAYNMTPAPSRAHQKISRELLLTFGSYLKRKACEIYDSPFDVFLSDDNIVQPDLVIVCDQAKLTERGCEGTPDLVVEILSPATSKKDLNEKFSLYERFGVKEYWIVFPFEGNSQIHVYTLNEGNAYGEPAVFAKGDFATTTLFEELRIEVSEIFS